MSPGIRADFGKYDLDPKAICDGRHDTMRRFCRTMLLAVLLLGAPAGCATTRQGTSGTVAPSVTGPPDSPTEASPAKGLETEPTEAVQTVGLEVVMDADEVPSLEAPSDSTDPPAAIETAPAAELQSPAAVSPVESDSLEADPLQTAAPPDASGAGAHAVQFTEVVDSVYRSYPLLQAVMFQRNMAVGKQIGATGEFDLKLKGFTEAGPTGFYQTYRHGIGVVQPTYWGGELFAGYRLGRGEFQPWFLERNTNDGGEFKAGVELPLARNRDIDARRAELWKAGYDRQLAEPEIQTHLIMFVLEGSYAYWDWVAAGENHRIAKQILALAEDRTERIEAQVDAGLVDPPELTDNLRLVAIRDAKVSDTRRKLEQTAAKLSVFFRDADGQPVVVTESQLPGFPEPSPVSEDQLLADIQVALASRPELKTLDLLRNQLQIDYSEAVNLMQPELNAVLMGSQDVGAPTSSKRDKSEYEAEAALYLDVPVQRRKARGKMTELQAKLSQLAAKRRITADKISVDVQMAHAALKSAWEQVSFTRDALRKAEDLAVRERQNQAAGASDLLKVTLREQYAVESAEKNVEALKLYFESEADYRAAMARDQLGP